MSLPPKGMSYKAAGVDIEAGDSLVDAIKPYVKATRRRECIGGLGGFGALFEVPVDRYQKPVLVSGTDGVGTKLKLAQLLDDHTTIGIDLVAMCVNDILVQGAEPLYFLDYYATGKLIPATAEIVIKGIAKGCEMAGMALVGGETAEMPGIYAEQDYDLAGFCVGIVEKENLITGEDIAPGDALIALGSSGPHSNGYSLIRNVLQTSKAELSMPVGATTLGQALIAPTRIYVKPVQAVMQQVNIKGMAHITGGGIAGNLIRILPAQTEAMIDLRSWELPAIFKWLAREGNIDHDELFSTFNCGVGMLLVVDSAQAEQTVEVLTALGEAAWIAGMIQPASDAQPAVKLNG